MKNEIKDSRMQLIQTCVYAIGGSMGAEILDPSLAPISLLMKIMGVLGITYYALTWSKFDLIFKNLGLGIGVAYPIIKSKKKTEFSDIYRFTLPKGLCLQDFLDKKEAIENALGREVDIKYTYKEILIEVYHENNKIHYEYVQTKLSGDVPILIGYSRQGELISCDLSQGESHIIIGGETGSGKSTVIRSIITNLILTTNVRLHLIDLKMGVEFAVFQKSSHVASFSRTINEANKVLQELCNEVERRSDLFYKKGVKDIKDYNKKFKSKPLTYEVLIIDEFADLQYNKHDLSLIEELGRKARSVGIHVIIATQRPDAKVVTGGIKINIGNILGLKTLNGTNSNIIIDETGLEKLRGKGHGKFKRGGIITEIQCPYLDIDKCKELIKFTYIEKETHQRNKPSETELLAAIQNI
jgi:S-DNA-T family DNA segregation ATPase FtsK/SpoIIIE